MEGVSKETKRIMAVGASVVALAAIAAYTFYGKKDAQENIITVNETEASTEKKKEEVQMIPQQNSSDLISLPEHFGNTMDAQL